MSAASDPRSTYLRDQLAAAVDQLAGLVPALREALEADSGAPAGERVSGGSEERGLPFNADVATALRLLDRTLVATVIYAAETAGEPGVERTVEASLAHATRLHERLLVLGHVDGANQLARGVRGALRAARMALGLDNPDRQLDASCPMHDDPLTPLVTLGAVGNVHWEAGRPVVRIEQPEGVHCRLCGAGWMPTEYGNLRALLDEAEGRRAVVNAA